MLGELTRLPTPLPMSVVQAHHVIKFSSPHSLGLRLSRTFCFTGTWIRPRPELKHVSWRFRRPGRHCVGTLFSPISRLQFRYPGTSDSFTATIPSKLRRLSKRDMLHCSMHRARTAWQILTQTAQVQECMVCRAARERTKEGT